MITFAPTPPFAAINTGNARTEGFESFAKWHPSSAWTLAATHTYTLARDETRQQSLVRRPKHQATLLADWQFNSVLDVGTDVRFVGAREDYDINFNRSRMPSFTTVGLFANYKLTPIDTVYARLDNALDKRYEEVPSYGTSGIAIYLGIKSNF